MRLYEEYPETVDVNGKQYEILTDFRNWIKFQDLVLDNQVGPNDKIYLMLQWYRDEKPEDVQEALNALVRFYLVGDRIEKSGEEKNEAEEKTPLFSFSEDSDYFLSAFRESYGISLKNIPYLHWYEFISLFRGLPAECGLKERMRIRAMNPNEIKDPKDRAKLKRMQKEIALASIEMSDVDIGDAFSGLF